MTLARHNPPCSLQVEAAQGSDARRTGRRSDAASLPFRYNSTLPANACHCTTYRVPENGAFWSITMYRAKVCMNCETNVLNKRNTTMEPDGQSFKARFGSAQACGDREGLLFLPRVSPR